MRHKPETIGLKLDDEGWVSVDKLLVACEGSKHPITLEELNEVVADNDKKRFIIRDGKIRANQGHSLGINLNLQPETPPEYLFHGTATRFMDAIRKEGLRKMKRQHVHLSSEVETAVKVGIRHGKPTILRVDAAEMNERGFNFFLSENKVWLTESVPWEYIREEPAST